MTTSSRLQTGTPFHYERRHLVARRVFLLGGGVFLLLVAIGASIFVGSRQVSTFDLFEALMSAGAPDVHILVWEVRVPRTVLGIVVGAALGASGMLIQALTRNPLADPGILGVNTGASFAVTIAIAFLGATSISSTLWYAYAGAGIVTLLVLIIGSRGRDGANPARLVLLGVSLSAVLTGIQSGITLLNPRALDGMRAWSVGSLASANSDDTAFVAPFIAVGIIVALCVARPLNLMGMGEELARTLGVHITTTRVVSVFSITLLAGGATALAGPIIFLGLIVPHICRAIMGPDQRWILPASIVLGPLLLLVSDVSARVIVWPGELPVGVVTAFIGAPLLIALIRGRKSEDR